MGIWEENVIFHFKLMLPDNPCFQKNIKRIMSMTFKICSSTKSILQSNFKCALIETIRTQITQFLTCISYTVAIIHDATYQLWLQNPFLLNYLYHIKCLCFFCFFCNQRLFLFFYLDFFYYTHLFCYFIYSKTTSLYLHFSNKIDHL